MNFLIRHAGVVIVAAFVSPTIYILGSSTSGTHMAVTPVTPTVIESKMPTPSMTPPESSPTETPRPTHTTISASTPSKTPIPTKTNTPTPKPSIVFTPTSIPPSSTPTLTPSPSLVLSPTQSSISSAQLDEWFTKYSNTYSIDRQQLKSIAVCESGLNPNAKNGDYGGLYQFASSTWISTRKAMNIDTNTDMRFNAEEAIKTASFKISVSGTSAWQNCL